MNNHAYSVAEQVLAKMDTQEDAPATEQGPEGEAEPITDVSTGTEDNGDEDPTEEEADDEYSGITDVSEAVKLLRQRDDRLAGKDRGYAQVEPYIKTGKLIEDVFRPDNPNVEQAVETLLANISERLGKTVSLDVSGVPIEEYDEDTQEFFKSTVAPHVDKVTRDLLKRISDLEAKLGEPLKAYETSKQESEFKHRVKDEAPKALRIFELRTGAKATEAELEAAMRKYPHNTPIDALTLHRPANRTSAQRTAPNTRPPSGTNVARVTHVDAYQSPKSAAERVAEEFWDKRNK